MYPDPDDRGVIGHVQFSSSHEGAPGFAHGGAVATALDDAFGMLLWRLERAAVTARLEVDYRRPSFLARRYEIVAWCDATDGRKLHFRAELRDDDGVVAEAAALFIEVDRAHFTQGQSGDTTLPW
jgi:acyl-coenzyme A thioesterase PaaI-like protein